MSQFTSPQSLLSLPGELLRPNPYQVFGLRVGESDGEAIAAAIRGTIRRLNESKASADPAAWKQAATWVTAAREQLKDPATKQRLDESLRSPGSAAKPQPPTTPRRATSPAVEPIGSAVEPTVPAVDPLAGLLPEDDAPSVALPSSAPATKTKPRLFAGRAVLPPSASSLAPTSPRPATPPPTPLSPTPLGVRAEAPPEPLVTVAANVQPPEPLAWEPVAATSPWGGPVTTPEVALPTSALPGLLVTPDASPERRPAGTRRRTSTFPWANAFLFFFAIACLGAVGALIYTVSRNPQGLVISLQTGGANGNPVPPAGTAVVAGPDPVMQRPGQANGGEPAGRGRPVRPRPAATRASTEQLSEADRWLQGLAESGEMPAMNGDQSEAAPATPMPAVPMTDAPEAMPPTPDTPMPDPSAPGTPAPEPDTPTPSPVPEATEPMSEVPADAPANDLIEAGEAALKRARDAVAKGEWSSMVELVDAAAAAAVTEPQKRSAAQLGGVAELATYYHGAIDKGLSGLSAGETFNLTEQLQIAVVEVAPDKLIVRFNGRNKEYPRGELPLVMAHKLARFSLPTESPVTQVAAEVYQTLAPVSSAQYRQQSLRKLEAMPEMVEDIRPADLVAAIRELDFD